MNVSLNEVTAIIGLSMAVLSHAVASIWWASKITTIVDNIGKSILSMERELEKRDRQIIALFNKLDDVKERIIVLETRNHV